MAPVRYWRCIICGYIAEGERPPMVCPICGATSEYFKPWEPPQGWPVKPENDTAKGTAKDAKSAKNGNGK